MVEEDMKKMYDMIWDINERTKKMAIEVEQIKKVLPNVPNKDNNSYTQQLLERAEKNINDRRNLH